MLTTLITLVPPSLPPGFCYPQNPQDLANALFAAVQVNFNSNVANSFFNYGDTVPTVENQPFPWLRTVNGVYEDTYNFTQGFWLSEYKRAPADSSFGVIWFGSEADLPTFDGGENVAVDNMHGPFWEVAHALDGRIIMGPGAIAGANPAKTLGVGENYGEAAHLQTSEEVGPHTHLLSQSQLSITPGSGATPGILYAPAGTGNPTGDLTVLANKYVNGQQSMPILPPLYGAFVIRRTNRIWKRI